MNALRAEVARLQELVAVKNQLLTSKDHLLASKQDQLAMKDELLASRAEDTKRLKRELQLRASSDANACGHLDGNPKRQRNMIAAAAAALSDQRLLTKMRCSTRCLALWAAAIISTLLV